MATQLIPIDKGVFKTQDPRTLRNSPAAENLVNLMLDSAGANFDRPTLSAFATVSTKIIIGCTYFASLLIVVTADRKLYTVDSSGTVVNITGTILAGTGRPVFANDGTTLFIAGGGAPLKWAGVGNTTAALGGSPPSATHVAYLDDFVILNRQVVAENNKVIQFSNSGDAETWTGTDIFSAVADPDPVQAIIVSQRDLYLVGQSTTEIWQNVGTSPIPFQRFGVLQYGTDAPYSVIEADNSVFFLDNDRRILRNLRGQPARVSEAIEREIATYETVSDCFASSFTYEGSIHVFFGFPDADAGWSIDLKNNQWTEWKGYDNGYSRVRINAMVYVPSLKTTYVGDHSTGDIFTFSSTVKTDAGGVFKRQRTFAQRDGGAGVRKRANKLRLNMTRNVASAHSGTTSQTNPQVELRWKDDNKDWSTWRRKSLGTIGETSYYAEFHRLGIYRTRQYEVQMSDPAEMNLVSVETDEDVMVS